MTADLTLFDARELVHPSYSPRASIDERWAQFRDANPWLLPYLGRLADGWFEVSGTRRTSMKALFERIRWDGAVTTRGDHFKVDNSFTAPATRDLIALRPDLEDAFSLRTRRAA